MYTGDGVHYDFQAAGEFMAASTPDGSLQIQSRQQPVLGGKQITFNTAVAALVDGDRVGVYADEPSFLEVNGKAVTAVDIAERLPGGGSLERHGGSVTVRWADGSALIVTEDARTLNYTFAPSTAIAAGLHGLLGNMNDDPADDLTGRDGSVLARSDPDFGSKVYSQFGNSWRIKQAESLFDYRPGESTATFTDLTIPSAPATVNSIPAASLAAARQICQAAGVRTEPLLDDCLIDVGHRRRLVCRGDRSHCRRRHRPHGSRHRPCSITGPTRKPDFEPVDGLAPDPSRSDHGGPDRERLDRRRD